MAPNLVNLALALAGAVVSAFGVAWWITPAVARLALRLGCVDEPGGRRLHAAATPRMGGLAIAAGVGAGMLASIWAPGAWSVGTRPMAAVFLASTGMLALGLADDLFQVSPARKLLVQTALAILCWVGGVRILGAGVFTSETVALPPAVAFLVTVGWIVGVTNAINLLDGLDGLAPGVVAIVASTMVAVGLTNNAGNVFLAVSCASLAAACLGFLVHNTPPARIFMGDTGSLFLGFLVANVSLLSSHKTAAATGLAIPLVALGVPVADTLIAFARRIAMGRSPFVGDRLHLHHVLGRVGLDERLAVRIIHAGTGGLCATAILAAQVDSRIVFLGFAGLAVGIAWLLTLAWRRKLRE